VSGYTTLHEQLEKKLAMWHGYPHGIIFNTGYAANAAVLGGLPREGDLVLADRLVHASMLSGIESSGAKLIRFPHNDLDTLELKLAEAANHAGAVFVVTESVYSMDGDSPDLKRLSELRERFGFCWILDEAHATGWHGATGSGLQEEQGVRGAADVVVGTLGKGLGSQGAYVLSRESAVREGLINFSGEFIYSTYLAPSSVAAGLAAIKCVEALGDVRGALQALSREWRAALNAAGFAVPAGHSAIIPVVLGDANRTVHFANKLKDAGIKVSAIRPPTVPAGTGRLRVSLRRGLSSAHLEKFIKAMKDAAL
jgi:8-amino-7-oxononanoate synthase